MARSNVAWFTSRGFCCNPGPSAERVLDPERLAQVLAEWATRAFSAVHLSPRVRLWGDPCDGILRNSRERENKRRGDCPLGAIEGASMLDATDAGTQRTLGRN